MDIISVHFENGDVNMERFAPAPAKQLAPESPRLFELQPAAPKFVARGEEAVVVSSILFQRNFNQITGGALSGFTPSDWDGVVVAGGAVLHSLSPAFKQHELGNGDIDLFLHGMSEEQARAKITRLFTLIKATPGCTGAKKVLAMRTPHTMTFVLPAPKRHIQIVLRLHSTAAEVIRAFDVDCCGFMYDGRAVRCTARAASAVAHRVNIAVPEKRSWTYESRLIKYAKRGYAIAVPGLDWSLVPEELGGPKLEQEEEAHVPDPPAGGRWSYVGGTLVENEEYKAWEKKWGEAYSEKQRKLHKRRFGGDDMYDYFEAEGLKKLLLANKNSEHFVKTRPPWLGTELSVNTRTKFIPHSGNTRDVAELIKASGEHYGPTLPDVPGVGKYKIENDVKPFLIDKNKKKPWYVAFKLGPIPTGVAEVGASPNWWEGVHNPPGANGSAGSSSGSQAASSSSAGPSAAPGAFIDHPIDLT